LLGAESMTVMHLDLADPYQEAYLSRCWVYPAKDHVQAGRDLRQLHQASIAAQGVLYIILNSRATNISSNLGIHLVLRNSR